MREANRVTGESSAFRILAWITTLLFVALAVSWMFAPAFSLSQWGIQSNDIAELVSRRIAALYTGIAVMFFFARNTPPSQARRAMVLGLVLACLILAALGLFEVYAGRAQPAILVVAAIEVTLAAAFLLFDRRPAHGDQNDH